MSLAGRQILVVEDLYFLAIFVADALRHAGAEIVGPYPSREVALSALKDKPIDAAVLDIGLSDGFVFPLAHELTARGIPFIFLSGYGQDVVPGEFGAVPFLQKPAGERELCQEVTRLFRTPNARDEKTSSVRN